MSENDNDLSNLKLSIEGGIALVTVNRPDKLNALTGETLDEIEAVFSRLSADESARGVIVTGAGEKAFVAGADIKELSSLDARGAYEKMRRGHAVFGSIAAMTKPVVAAVNGFALGGGLELALACHLRVAAESAKLGLPEVKLGAIPGYGGTQRLPRLVGKGRALELILTGEPIDATEAYRIGLVNRVVPPSELIESCRELLGKMLANGPLALGNALVAVGQGLEMDMDRGLVLEASLFGVLCASEDFEEGTTAFLEKRKARFAGR